MSNTVAITGYDQLAELVASSLNEYLRGRDTDAVAGINGDNDDEVYVVQAGGTHYILKIEEAKIEVST